MRYIALSMKKKNQNQQVQLMDVLKASRNFTGDNERVVYEIVRQTSSPKKQLENINKYQVRQQNSAVVFNKSLDRLIKSDTKSNTNLTKPKDNMLKNYNANINANANGSLKVNKINF